MKQQLQEIKCFKRKGVAREAYEKPEAPAKHVPVVGAAPAPEGGAGSGGGRREDSREK